ncbi:hypothetical protein ACER0A_011120 [Haloimpatiens sp. FM7315]|uniref:hypothetical protein n=1 Tax=Haloimpatiens sp. FM7315 TaxID=3298609 RepID=UPI0035A345D8
MNVFDVGGLISFMALVGSIIIGTAIFVGLHKIFDIVHFGFGAIIGMWCVCCLVAAFIVNMLSGIIGWALSTVWLLVKIALVIVVVGSIVKFIYNKISRNKE